MKRAGGRQTAPPPGEEHANSKLGIGKAQLGGHHFLLLLRDSLGSVQELIGLSKT